ncbi:MAG: hypothetical protein QNJ62_13735 [Methyloceanibacter sp.]|nr:hypothetical protein [Methyloceanibacter sp.]
MYKTLAGLAAIIVAAGFNPALADPDTEAFQNDEMPGSEIQIDIGKDGADIHRKSGKPLFGGDMNLSEEEQSLAPLDDPDDPVAPDPIDAELPGEGPEDLSGPDDEDPLPY